MDRPIRTNIKNVFWNIPVLDYSTPKNGVIKKQIKYSSTCKEEVDYITEQLKDTVCYEEHIIEHIDNPEGRIKYKDQRKISIGTCKKDIMSYRSKKKRAFFNCFVLILRLFHENTFKEVHVKVFNTGKLEIPGIQNDNLLHKVLTLLVDELTPFIDTDLSYLKDNSETVLINSNFNCGYYIDRDKLHDLLKYKYRINSNFDACSYPGIQCRFYYNTCDPDYIQTGCQPSSQNSENDSWLKISFMIFRTGSVLMVGKCSEAILNKIYRFIRDILEREYTIIGIDDFGELKERQQRVKSRKYKKRIIYIDGSS